jgi:hypothetical protein
LNGKEKNPDQCFVGGQNVRPKPFLQPEKNDPQEAPGKYVFAEIRQLPFAQQEIPVQDLQIIFDLHQGLSESPFIRSSFDF